MPNKENSSNLYYSFDINDIHIVSLNSEIPFYFQKHMEEEDYESYKQKFQTWLENDLKKSRKKWKIVYLSRPLYCSLNDDSKLCTQSAEKMRDLLDDIINSKNYKVDLVLSGHVHAYERSYPIYKNIIDKKSVQKEGILYDNPKYPVHVLCGTGGSEEGFQKCI